MQLVLSPEPLPLRQDSHGSVRVGQTRVTLDTVIHAYSAGHYAEEIVDMFPSLSLADVHSVIAFYLRNREAVDAYLCERQQEAQKLREQIEKEFPTNGLRERLLARRAAMQANNDAPPAR